MKKCIVIAGLMIGLSLCFLALSSFIRAQEDTVALECNFGKVTFSHKEHTALASCQDCHHTGLGTPKCSTCHKEGATMDAKTALHKNCIDCHKDKGAGPTGCMDCHKK
jgi:hypothetical protein